VSLRQLILKGLAVSVEAGKVDSFICIIGIVLFNFGKKLK
jgi:hypothetical protein